MKIDYKKELENASKTMILIHDPRTLIRLIVRMIVRKVHIRHAAMILYDPYKDSYVLTISRGETGIKIPAGFARFNRDSPLIKLFTQRSEFKTLPQDRDTLIASDIDTMIWKESVISDGNGTKDILHKVSEQLKMFNAVACVPAYYRDGLMAVLLLGEKVSGEKFDNEELDFFAALASDVAMAIKNAQLFGDLRLESKRNRDLFVNTTLALTSTIEAKDPYTKGHTERVTRFALAIAYQMIANHTARFSHQFVENLQVASLLHDIGKIGVPEKILQKTSPLNQKEYEEVKKHTTRGIDIVQHITEQQECLDGVKYHHERYDGKGYPEGLAGDDVPIIAAIIAVADTFDAMTTDRPYRKSLPKKSAIEEIQRNIGIQFNPLPAHAMIELFETGRV